APCARRKRTTTGCEPVISVPSVPVSTPATRQSIAFPPFRATTLQPSGAPVTGNESPPSRNIRGVWARPACAARLCAMTIENPAASSRAAIANLRMSVLRIGHVGNERARMEPRDEPRAARSARKVVYVDASGAVVDDPAEAAAGEILEHDAAGATRVRAWFRVEEVQLRWLPVRESAFLLWVLAIFILVWLVIGVVIGFR